MTSRVVRDLLTSNVWLGSHGFSFFTRPCKLKSLILCSQNLNGVRVCILDKFKPKSNLQFVVWFGREKKYLSWCRWSNIKKSTRILDSIFGFPKTTSPDFLSSPPHLMPFVLYQLLCQWHVYVRLLSPTPHDFPYTSCLCGWVLY